MTPTRWEIVLLAFGLLPAACSSEFVDDRPAASDAGLDAPLVPDAPAADPDAATRIGDVCGDRSGLQMNAPWPMLGGCPKRAGFAPRTATFTTTVRWTTDAPSVDSSPVITAEGFVWFGTTDGRAVAVSSYYGNLLTSVKLGADPVRSSAAIEANGRAVFGYGNFVYAVDVGGMLPPTDAGDDGGDAGVPSGTSQVMNAQGPIESSPAITKDGSIIVATKNGRVAAMRIGAEPKWNIVTDGDGVASPAIGSNGRIYVAGANSALYALDADTGGKLWQAPIGAALRFIAVGGDDTVYVGAADGKLHAVAPDGKERWVFTASGPISGAPAVYAGIVYVGTEGKKLHAVATADGKQKWEYATLGAVASPTISSDGTIYFGASDGYLYALEPSGLLYFALNLKAAVKGAPAIADDGTLYVTTATSIVAVGP